MSICNNHPAALPRIPGRIFLFLIIGLLLVLSSHYASKVPSSLLTLSSPTIITQPAHQISLQTIDLSSPSSPFIAWPLARVCAEATFVPGLVFICDNNSGGPGNIRNYILTCLRYAIEAGSTSLVLPRIRSRSVTDLSNIHVGYQGFGYMFDAAHFRRGLASGCPQIDVYDRVEDVPHVLEKVEREGLYDVEKMIERITPRQDYGNRVGCDQRDLNRHTDRFGARFRDWLNSSVLERGMPEISVQSPRLIRLNWGVLFDWEVLRDGPEFVATFGGLLRFNDELLQLGQAVTRALRTEASFVEGSQTGQEKNRFLGVHLRTEADALKQWPSFEVQVAGYVKESQRLGFQGGIAYLASGSEAEAIKFKDFAQSEMQLQVRTKHDLLEVRDLEKLQKLSWDQQAVVDFQVLLAANYFVGALESRR
ncbi:hypothetical protein TruAng_001428 [Truncatella angustata]|nr:hypothetical protein TruAng_001428 [Truncatella angustata]